MTNKAPAKTMTMHSKCAIYLALVGILATLLFSSPVALGQGATAAMNGSILDPTGAAVPGAEVSLKNLDNGVAQSATSNAEGRYVFVALTPGHYSLRVTK